MRVSFDKELFRVKVDDRNESMGLKTREAQTQKVPFMLVIGDKEIESKSVSVRRYGEMKSTTMSIEEMKTLFRQLDKEKMPKEFQD